MYWNGFKLNISFITVCENTSFKNEDVFFLSCIPTSLHLDRLAHKVPPS